ncbi:MAG: glycosyltransferase [Dokdonella sp.]|uniref:glycosyltransferase family 2 protein n=1 Tax=Dokdonella sp. TaxID=2291710 RepID=UPI0032633F8C
MFGFLRRTRLPLIAPLRSIDWNGDTLTLVLDADADADAEVTLDIDGCFFSPFTFDEKGRATLSIPFSPAGQPVFHVLPRVRRNGAELVAQPLRATQGIRGLVAAPAVVPALSQSTLPACCVPFGVELAAVDMAIVVPVYNAPAMVAACLDAVLAQTRGRARLIIIDDASTDAGIAPLLARYDGIERVEVLRNAENLGFTGTANRGIAHAGRADVVLLNADTEVGPQWLAGLRRAAYADDEIATATAVSDNAGAFSVPELEQANETPAAWSGIDCARASWQHAGMAYPQLPTGNGFCLYIRRSVIDAVGVLDEAAFPQGYGEENDFCQRASALGLRHVIAGNVWVRHARSMSFGDERRHLLGRAGMDVLRERWPRYEADVGATLLSFERRVLDWRVRRLYSSASAANRARMRVLWVGAGAPDWPDAEVWNLRANGARNELVCDERIIATNTWEAADPEPSYRALWNWLQIYAIEWLVVGERKQSAAEILCGLLDIPIAIVQPTAPSAIEALRAAESDTASFPERRA